MTDIKAIPSDRISEEFFAHVGYAISRWAFIDRQLFDFCGYALNVSEEKAAVIFYRSNSIKEHLSLTNDLMKLSLRKRHLIRWDHIVTATDNLIPFRNDLAHNPAVGIVELQDTFHLAMRAIPLQHHRPS